MTEVTYEPTADPTSDPTYEVVWPKSALGVQSRPLAERVDTLDGKRVAFLWDYLFRGDELFPQLREHLVDRFPQIEILGYEVFGNTHGSEERQMIAALPAELHRHRVDAVISGIGC